MGPRKQGQCRGEARLIRPSRRLMETLAEAAIVALWGHLPMHPNIVRSMFLLVGLFGEVQSHWFNGSG